MRSSDLPISVRSAAKYSQQYAEKGFLHLPGMISEQTCAQLLHHLQLVGSKQKAESHHWPHLEFLDLQFEDFLFEHPLSMLATQLLGKLPKEESLDAVWLGKQELSLQQAAWKMCLAPWDAISVWIMLDGNPGDLCCYTVPGSHLKGLEEHVPEPRSLDGHTIPGAQSTEHFPVSRGDVILTHALTIYGWRGHHPGQRTTSLRATFCAADASLSEASRAWLKEQGIISQGDY